MTDASWYSPPVLVAISAAAISFLAAASSVWAAWVSTRMLKRQRDADRPAVTCKWENLRDEWPSLRILVENPTIASWEATSVRVVRPSDLKIVSLTEAEEQDDFGAPVFSKLKAAAAAGRSARPYLKVSGRGSAGAPWVHGSRGDQSSAKVFFRPETLSGKTFKLMLELESLEPNPRRLKYGIERRPPAELIS